MLSDSVVVSCCFGESFAIFAIFRIFGALISAIDDTFQPKQGAYFHFVRYNINAGNYYVDLPFGWTSGHVEFVSDDVLKGNDFDWIVTSL